MCPAVCVSDGICDRRVYCVTSQHFPALSCGADINPKQNRARCHWLGGESGDNLKRIQRDTRPLHNDDGKNNEQDGEDDDDDDDNSHHNDRNVEDDEHYKEVQDNEEDI